MTLDPQVVINQAAAGTGFVNQVQRDPVTGAILNVDTPEQNLGRFIQEGIDYEMVYIFETSRLGHGDWGTLTTTCLSAMASHLRRDPIGTRQIRETSRGVCGGFLGANGGGSLTHNRFYASLFYDKDGVWGGQLDTGVTVHYVGQYWDTYGFGTFINHVRPPFTGPSVCQTGNPNDPICVGFTDRKVREWIYLWIDSVLKLFITPTSPAPLKLKRKGLLITLKMGGKLEKRRMARVIS